MIHCTIKGCKNSVSESISLPEERAKWRIFRACRCGAFRSTIQNPQVCKCRQDGPFPIQYWPLLDWWIFGGVDEVVLCPDCMREVYAEICKLRGLDPSMNPESLSPGNRH